MRATTEEFQSLAPCDRERFTLATGLHRRDPSSGAESFAADHVAVAVLMNPKPLAVFHDKVEVVAVRDLLIDAAADCVGDLAGTEGHDTRLWVTHLVPHI